MTVHDRLARPSSRRPAMRLQASAHRGDSARFRENTLPAIRSAIAAGAEFVEIDVRVTSDGFVIVLHDPTLQRLWGLPVAVTDVPLSTVQELGDPDDRPPLLTEVLALFPGTASTLLIDMDDPSLAEPAYRVAAEAGAGASIAWCGHLDGMRTIRSLDPAARIWMPWAADRAPTPAEIVQLRPECINCEVLTMTAHLVEQIHDLGCSVTVWTVDDEFTMRWAKKIGVDTVTTNRLGRLRRVADEEAPGPASPGEELDLDAALAVARGLGEWAIGYSSTADPGQIDTKKDAADLVTQVDVAVERHVRDVIGQRFPHHDFVGEEMGGAARPGVPCWYLDPVDGTANFANRIPWNAFSLALVVDRDPQIAVVADPWRGDLFEAVRDRGARLNGTPLVLPAGDHLSDGALPDAGDDRTHAGPGDPDPLSGRIVSTELADQLPWPGMIDMLGRLGARYCTMRIMGSGTMSLVGVAAGRGVGAVIGKFGPVDHLAAALIVQEAGGVVLDSRGERTLFPVDGGIMAASPSAAATLHALWQEAVAASVGD